MIAVANGWRVEGRGSSSNLAVSKPNEVYITELPSTSIPSEPMFQMSHAKINYTVFTTGSKSSQSHGDSEKQDIGIASAMREYGKDQGLLLSSLKDINLIDNHHIFI